MLNLLAAVLPLILSIVVAFKAEEVNKQTRWKVVTLGFGLLCTVMIYVQQQKSDRDAEKERGALTRSIETLKDEARTSQIRYSGDMGFLKAKLEDAINQAKTPAIDTRQLGSELAKANLDLIRKESQRLSDKQLAEAVRAFAAKMRTFEAGYKAKYESSQLPSDVAAYFSDLHNKESLEFRNDFLGQAIAYKDQLEERVQKPSNAVPGPVGRAQILAFQGFLAGVSPISDAADYLEWLARRLSP